MFKEAGEDLIITFTKKMGEREKRWPNQKYHKKDHTLCKLKREKNIIFVCAENPKTSHCVTVLMREQVLVQEFSSLPKMESSGFADANIVKMKQASVTELTAHCNILNSEIYYLKQKSEFV